LAEEESYDFHAPPTNEPAIDRFADLKGLKLGVRHPDLRIAAITLENQGTLVTRNTKDFHDIPDLTIVDWSL
jgi:predicted nucleic acid-binding protein